MKRWLLLGIIVMLLGLALVSPIEAAQFFSEVGYYDFSGTIGNLGVLMSLYFDEGQLTGTYVYLGKEKEIEVLGRVRGDDVVLSEYVGGMASGVFEGKILPKGDVIRGTWSGTRTGKVFPFELDLHAIVGEKYGHRYALAGWENDEDLIRFVKEIKGYIKNGDKQALAKLVSYPVSVDLNGKKANLATEGQFVRNYDKVFHPAFTKVLLTTYPGYLFVNWQGVMFGEAHRNLWLSYAAIEGDPMVPRITAINN